MRVVVPKVVSVCQPNLNVTMTVESLPSRAAFDAVFESPDAKHGQSEFLILAKHNQDVSPQPVVRIGFVTSKKKIKRAVDRNRFRRVFKDRLRALPDLSPSDWVVIARATPANLHDSTFHQDVDKALARIQSRLMKVHANS